MFVVFTVVVFTVAAAAVATADVTACCEADKGAAVTEGEGEAALLKSDDSAAELELKALVASGVASGVVPKLSDSEEEVLDDEPESRGTSCSAA